MNQISNLHHEDREFGPSEKFSANANAQAELYETSPLQFWAEQAGRLHWDQPWQEIVRSEDPAFAEWFVGGRLNASVNCVDRHVAAGLGDRTALIFEGEPGDHRVLTYRDLQQAVSQAAHALTELGIGSGDRVAIYMPLIPEVVVAMLACARLGAIHSVVFGGFSAEALRSRIEDASARLVITADGGFRRGSAAALKPAVDEAVAHCPSVEHVLVVRRTGQDVEWTERDTWWHEIVERQPTHHDAESFDSEHPLFILYTSGTTGKPKGILHTTGGYLTHVSSTHFNVFDIKPSDIYWCTADVGWVTGHSYVVYGPLANASTVFLYEGTPDTPHQGRWWELIEKYQISILYTAPTAIRTFMKWGDHIPAQHDLSSLRLLGSVGEPINPEAWMWYREVIGRSACPIVDTWWQTETGGIMISPLPGVTVTKPGSAMTPLPGVSAKIIDENAEPVARGGAGYLVLDKPWPGMLRGIWGDKERYLRTYWSRWPGLYFAGDGAKLDQDGAFWLLGRVDDVMNVSGHRITTAEVEHALVSHPYIAEAAVVGANDERTGQGIVAFVILRSGAEDGPHMAQLLREHVTHEIGAIAKPRQILVVSELPKTRSGKIMRRLLKDVAEERDLGDVTTLSDPTVMTLIREGLTTHPAEE